MATVAGVNDLAGSKESPAIPGVGVTLLVRAKFGRFDGADKDVVVAMVLLPRPKLVPEVIVAGVPNVKPVTS